MNTWLSWCFIENQTLKKIKNEIYRVLKNGCYGLITLPQIWGLREEPKDYFRLTKYGISHLLEKNNLKIVFLENRGVPPMATGQMSVLFIKQILNNCLKFIIFPFAYVIPILSLIFDKLDKNHRQTLGYVVLLGDYNCEL